MKLPAEINLFKCITRSFVAGNFIANSLFAKFRLAQLGAFTFGSPGRDRFKIPGAI